MKRTAKKSRPTPDDNPALVAWRRDAERGMLRALRVESSDSSSENLPESHKGDG